jgi:hypothetical protein
MSEPVSAMFLLYAKGVAKVSIEKISQYPVLLSKSDLKKKKNIKDKQIYFARI